jgi:hypothetical protein
MAADRAVYFGGVGYAAHHMPNGELLDVQLSGLQQRFDDLKQRLPVLSAMAQEQRIEGIGMLDDVVSLLLPHTIYKSYPARGFLATGEQHAFIAPLMSPPS